MVPGLRRWGGSRTVHSCWLTTLLHCDSTTGKAQAGPDRGQGCAYLPGVSQAKAMGGQRKSPDGEGLHFGNGFLPLAMGLPLPQVQGEHLVGKPILTDPNSRGCPRSLLVPQG